MTWTNSVALSPEERVKLVVGGNFTIDALGPLFNETLAAIAADPAAHFRAFERLYLARRPGRRTLTELHLPAFVAIIARHLPLPARQAARALLARSTSLARAQEAELAETTDESAAQEIARQRRQLEARRDALGRIAGA